MGEIAVVVEQSGATPSEATLVAQIRRDGPPCAGSFGPNLAEAKDSLAAGLPAVVGEVSIDRTKNERDRARARQFMRVACPS